MAEWKVNCYLKSSVDGEGQKEGATSGSIGVKCKGESVNETVRDYLVCVIEIVNQIGMASTDRDILRQVIRSKYVNYVS